MQINIKYRALELLDTYIHEIFCLVFIGIMIDFYDVLAQIRSRSIFKPF